MTIHVRATLVATITFATSGWATFAGDLPDPNLTPGLANPALTRDALCAPGFSPKSIRNVPTARRKQVYIRYSMAPLNPPCPCEVDHLIPLDLGGSNDLSNLWPQPYSATPWNSKIKDQLEIQLHTEVCSGKTELLEAQHEVVTDWTKAYLKRFPQP